MSDLDPRQAIDVTTGEIPSPEFVARLRAELERELDQDPGLAGQSDGARTAASDVPVIDAVLDDKEEHMGSNRKWALIGAAAAIVVLIVGLVIITNDDGEGAELDTVIQPDQEADAEPDPAPAESTTTTLPAIEFPDFEFTVIEVDGDWSYHADADTIWAVELGEMSLRELDLETSELRSTVELPIAASGLTVGPDAVWVGHANGMISRVDPATDTVVATIDVGGQPGSIAIEPDSIWVGTGDAGVIVRVDKATNAVTANVEVGTSGFLTAGAGAIWLGDTPDQLIRRIDPETNAVVSTIEVGVGGGFSVGPDAVWKGSVEPDIGGVVSRIDPETNEVSAVVEFDSLAGGLTIPGGLEVTAGSVWVRYGYDCDAELNCTNAIARIDTATNSVVATEDLPDGFPAGGIRVAPTTAWISTEGLILRIDF